MESRLRSTHPIARSCRGRKTSYPQCFFNASLTLCIFARPIDYVIFSSVRNTIHHEIHEPFLRPVSDVKISNNISLSVHLLRFTLCIH